MFPFAHQRRDAKNQFGSLCGWHVTPRLKGFVGSFDRAIGEVFRSLVKSSDDLRAVRRINAVEFAAGLDAFAANDEWVFAAQLALHFVERGAHRRRVFFFSEIGKWFVTKFSWHDYSATMFSEFSLCVPL